MTSPETEGTPNVSAEGQPAQPEDASSKPVDYHGGAKTTVSIRENANENTLELVADYGGAPVVFATVKHGVADSAQAIKAAADEASAQAKKSK